MTDTNDDQNIENIKNVKNVRFACDAMMGALARWLRAAGYDCFWRERIDDGDLIDLARRENRILLTADSGIFKRNVIIRGEVKALYVQRELTRDQQVAYVLRTLDMPRLEPRCMACGGKLETLDRETARRIVPPKAFEGCEEFYRCLGCGKTYWQGTHWASINRRLDKLGLKIIHPDQQKENLP